jgi:AcrR family transcriptional regulator
VAQLPDHLSAAPVGRERISSEALAEHQRARILEPATGVFAKRGFQETTIDNIVAASKSSVGSFYQLFDGKETCFLAVYDRIVADARERVMPAISADVPWGARAVAGLHELLAIFVAEPLAARIVLIEAQTAGVAATARYNAIMDAMAEWLRDGRVHYPDSADLPDSFEQAAVAGFVFFLEQRLLASEPLSVEALFGDASLMILEPIVGAGELAQLSDELAAASA